MPSQVHGVCRARHRLPVATVTIEVEDVIFPRMILQMLAQLIKGRRSQHGDLHG